MENRSGKYIKFLPAFAISLLILALSITSTAIAAPLNKPFQSKVSNTIELAYFKVYRANPRWGYKRPAYRGRGYFNHRPVCKRRCLVNQYGTPIRCKVRCY
ncbi:hypothetical protein [Legionella fairfieldensis]|uniref:hypothetical protein n=1 Tax=Legionella fairfieldensis TaxID=45064 RepID=UPI0004903BCB|nr:hypothetical protein [Legionella fairfieldensis]